MSADAQITLALTIWTGLLLGVGFASAYRARKRAARGVRAERRPVERHA
jgi:hypothetical protein